MSASLRKFRALVGHYTDASTGTGDEAGIEYPTFVVDSSSDDDGQWWCAKAQPTGREATVGMKPEWRIDAVFNFSAFAPVVEGGLVLVDGMAYHARAVLARDYGRDEVQVYGERDQDSMPLADLTARTLTGALALAGEAPIVRASVDNPAIDIGLGTVTMTGVAPTVTASANSPVLTPALGVLAAAGFAPAISSSVVASGLLPLNRQGPQWGVGDALMRAAAAGDNYTDPVTGAMVVKLTDGTTNAAGGGHEYASLSEITSLPWTSGPDTFVTIIYGTPSSGTTKLLDLDVATGAVSNRRNGPSGAAFTRLQLCFSRNPATPRILYYLGGTRESTIRRYDTATDTLAPLGNFPKDCSGSTTGTYHEALQVDDTDTIFCFQHGIPHNYAVAYDDNTDTIRVKTSAELGAPHPAWAGLDEVHLRRDGAGLLAGGNDAGGQHPITYWRFDTGVITDGTSTLPGVVHSDSVDDLWVTNCTGIGGLQGFYTFDVESATRTRILTMLNSTDGTVHCSGHYQTPGATVPADRWWGTSTTQDGIVSNWTSLSWGVYSGTIGVDAVYTVQPSYRWSQTSARLASGGLAWQTETLNTNSWRAVLTHVASIAAVQATAGTFYHDAGANRTYLRPLDELDLTNPTYRTHIGLVCPNALCEGVGLFKLDGSGGSLVAHHYSTAISTGDYWAIPRAHLMQSGLGYIWTSNMNVLGGRTDCFVALFPGGALT